MFGRNKGRFCGASPQRAERSGGIFCRLVWVAFGNEKSAQNTDGDFIVARGESDQFFEGARKVVVVIEAYPFGYFFKGDRALV